MKTKKISVIITNFNTKDVLKDCLINLFEQKVNLEIIVTDSGSTDGSAEMVKKNFGRRKNLILIEKGNVGIAGGYNFALQKATGDYYLFLGTDAFPKKDTLLGILDYFEDKKNKKVGAATAKLVTRDGNLDMDAHRGTLTPWVAFTHFSGLGKLFKGSKLFGRYFLSYENLDEPHEVGACISHFMFVRKSAQKKVGKWDENFFVFGEDIDYCYRIIKAGFKIMYLPQFKVLHIKGAGMNRKTAKGIVTASQVSPSTRYILAKERTRAMKLYFNKHLKDSFPRPLAWIVNFSIDVLEKVRILRV